MPLNKRKGGNPEVRTEREGNGATAREASLFPTNGSGGRRWRARRRASVREEARRQGTSAAVASAVPAVLETRLVGEAEEDSGNTGESNSKRSPKASQGSKQTADSMSAGERGPDQRGNKHSERQKVDPCARARAMEATSSWAYGRGAASETGDGEEEPGAGVSTSRLEAGNVGGAMCNETGVQRTPSDRHPSPCPSAAPRASRETDLVPCLHSLPASTLAASAGPAATLFSSPLGASASSPRPSAHEPTACRPGSLSPDRTGATSSVPASSSPQSVPSSSRPQFSGGSPSPSLASAFASASSARSSFPFRAAPKDRPQPDPPQGCEWPSPGPASSSRAPTSSCRLCPDSPLLPPTAPGTDPAAALLSPVASSSSSAEEEPAVLASLRKELTCSICLELLQLPVTVDCGHTFCRYCISHNKIDRRACPLCRQPLSLSSSLSINTVLANLLTLLGMRRGKKGGFPAWTLVAKEAGNAPTGGGKTASGASSESREVSATGPSCAGCLSAERGEAATHAGSIAATGQRDGAIASLGVPQKPAEPGSQPERLAAPQCEAPSVPPADSPLDASPLAPAAAGVSGDDLLEPAVEVRAPTAEWWAETCVKPKLAMPLVLRLLLRELGEDSIVFFDDLVGCVVEEFEKKELWSAQRWLFTLQDLETFARLVRFDREDQRASQERIRLWVEDYVDAMPRVCSRRFITDPVSGCRGRIMMRVLPDPQHKIESRVVDSADIRHSLPWDLGRHHQSLIHIPHSSVSLSHLQLLPQPGAEADELAVLDLGSTIGTMLLIDGTHTLQSGDVIHLGDRIEIAVEIVPARLIRQLAKRRQRERKPGKMSVRSIDGLDFPAELSRSGQDGGAGDCCWRQPYRQQLSSERGWPSLAGTEVARGPHTKGAFPSSFHPSGVSGAAGAIVWPAGSGAETVGDTVGMGLDKERLGLALGLPTRISNAGLFGEPKAKGRRGSRGEGRGERTARNATHGRLKQPQETRDTLRGERPSGGKRDNEDRETARLERRRLRKLLEAVPPNPFLDMQWIRSRKECFSVPRPAVEGQSQHRGGTRQPGDSDSGADWCSQSQVRSHPLHSSAHPHQREARANAPMRFSVVDPATKDGKTGCPFPSHIPPSHVPSTACTASPEESRGSGCRSRSPPETQVGDSEKDTRLFTPCEGSTGAPSRAETRGALADAGRSSAGGHSQERHSTASTVAPLSSAASRRAPTDAEPRRRETSAPEAGGGEAARFSVGLHPGARRSDSTDSGRTSEPLPPLPRLGSTGMPARSELSPVSADVERGAVNRVAPQSQYSLCVEDPFTGSRCLPLERRDTSAPLDGGRGHEEAWKDRTGERGPSREAKEEEGRGNRPTSQVTADTALPCLLQCPSAPLSGAASVYAGTAESIAFSSPRRELRSSLSPTSVSRDPTQDEDVARWLGSNESEEDLSDDSSDEDLSDWVRPGETEPLDSFLLLRITDAPTAGAASSHLPSVSSAAGGNRSRNENAPADEESDGLEGADRQTSKSLSLLPPGFAEWASPTGVVLGRGPHNPLRGFKKIAVTTNNGYISRVHCLIYYDGSRPPNQRWVLKDASTLGTYLRLKPFEPRPCPLTPKCILKVGQCKVEISLRGSASPVPASRNIGGTVSSAVVRESRGDPPPASGPSTSDSSSTSARPRASHASAPPSGTSSDEASSAFSSNLLSQRSSASSRPSTPPREGFASLFRLPLFGSSQPEAATSRGPPSSTDARTSAPSSCRGVSDRTRVSEAVSASASRAVSPVHSFVSGASFTTAWAPSPSSSVDLSSSDVGFGNGGRRTGPPTRCPRHMAPSSSLTRAPPLQHLLREPSLASLQLSPSPPRRLNSDPLPAATFPASHVAHGETGPRTQANTRGAQSRVYASGRGSGREPFPAALPAFSPPSSGGLRELTIASSAGCSSSAFAPP
ncbi:zinc finger (C3HC4 type) / FHA domain-containing protein [Neospora caninum Liverpool]|uniref:E3 ubiquitin-protein ligase CHFR n=1 Tax=Neospora caninum (strain Liverpool) TaxID=572307 RepID=F0VF42_NEOCL|nr:zinc finger (C3HC4 type) / FHA domain-containing protein [Neospora caninum Liverpool]CBZ52336.1 zinc finger (C3HC4 type) / FHA domain-containing protein [Neospora caninum Liverpool]CEL66304.1 TPA: zinc finger (C3HC4 type) / FHA domain-containing protein, putative [Neospora caninum Liverpool]|eukprot:XP_003882368.1 zinc finger (C3HC4 type) / FHA domain-containing protein [Neospora caninum Liverpool]